MQVNRNQKLLRRYSEHLSSWSLPPRKNQKIELIMRENKKKSLKENEIEKLLGNNKYRHFCLLSV